MVVSHIRPAHGTCAHACAHTHTQKCTGNKYRIVQLGCVFVIKGSRQDFIFKTKEEEKGEDRSRKERSCSWAGGLQAPLFPPRPCSVSSWGCLPVRITSEPLQTGEAAFSRWLARCLCHLSTLISI